MFRKIDDIITSIRAWWWSRKVILRMVICSINPSVENQIKYQKTAQDLINRCKEALGDESDIKKLEEHLFDKTIF